MKEQPQNGFDSIAAVYDLLARMVFGKSIVQAQTAFLDQVESRDKVLILGGGTGWLLKELLIVQPDCEVWYIESSSKMLEMAKRKCGNHSSVHFILGTHQSIPLITFDVVILNFFLDLFSPEALDELIERLKIASKVDGTWLVADFEDEGKWWQRILLNVMIVFFRITCGIDINGLPPWRSALASCGLRETAHLSFFRGFIRACSFKIESGKENDGVPG